DPLRRPRGLRFALHRGKLPLQLGAVLAGALELRLDQGLLGPQRLERIAVPAIGDGELLAQVRLDLARGFGIAPMLVALLLALHQFAALVGKAHLESGKPPAEDLGLRDLAGQLALQLGDALAELLYLAAFLGELARGGVRIEPLAGEEMLGIADVLLQPDD